MFFSIIIRSNQKLITSEGILPRVFEAQHKSHIRKEMYTAMTDFILNHNDIKKGVQAYSVLLVRVGRMIKATKDLFKRVYKNDRTYNYSTIISNKVRIKGNLYFKPCEMTGSKEGTEKEPKISLVWTHREITIPDMDELARKLGKSGRKIVVFVRQKTERVHTIIKLT